MDSPNQFFELLYKNVPEKYISELRFIPETGGKPTRLYRPASYLPSGNFEALTEINQHAHIYHRLGLSLQNRSRKQDIVMLTCLWIDIDEKSPEILSKIENHHYPPTMLVDSGGGYHAYFLLRDPIILNSDKARFQVERTMQGMILDFGNTSADVHTKDCTRILRTPFFLNIKAKYAPDYPQCKIVWADESRGDRYPMEWLYNRYAPLGSPEKQIIRRELPVINKNELPQWIVDYLEHGVAEGSRNKRLYDIARGLWDLGHEQLDILNKVSARAAADGLRNEEISATVKSACNNPRNLQSSLESTMRKRYSWGDNRKD